MSEYTIILKDPYNNMIIPITNFLKLEYFRAENQYGSVSIDIPYNDYLKSLNIKLDSRIEIWRNPIGGKLYLEGDTQFFVRIIRKKVDEQGRKIFHILAHDAISLLDRRIVNYPSGSSEADKSSVPASDVMKEIIDENFGSSASSDRDVSEWLIIDDDNGYGSSITKKIAWRNVLNVLQEIAEESKEQGYYLAFDVVYDVTIKKLIFRTYAGQRGAYKAEESNDKLIFEISTNDYPNIGRGLNYISVEHNAVGERTFIYVGGRGEQTNKIFAEASNDTVIEQSPFGRNEDFVDFQKADDADSLENQANARLREATRYVYINSHLQQMRGYRYGIDYYYGDLIEIWFDGEQYKVHIDRVQIVVQNGKEDIRIYPRGKYDEWFKRS